MSDIFISYNSKDSVSALALKSALLDRGFDVWMDTESIYAGDIHSKELNDAIRCSKVGLYLFGRNGQGNFQQRERDTFFEVRGERKEAEIPDHPFLIIPIRFREYTGELPGLFNDMSWVDFRRKEVDKGPLSTLMESLNRALGNKCAATVESVNAKKIYLAELPPALSSDDQIVRDRETIRKKLLEKAETGKDGKPKIQIVSRYHQLYSDDEYRRLVKHDIGQSSAAIFLFDTDPGQSLEGTGESCMHVQYKIAKELQDLNFKKYDCIVKIYEGSLEASHPDLIKNVRNNDRNYLVHGLGRELAACVSDAICPPEMNDNFGKRGEIPDKTAHPKDTDQLGVAIYARAEHGTIANELKTELSSMSCHPEMPLCDYDEKDVSEDQLKTIITNLTHSYNMIPALIWILGDSTYGSRAWLELRTRAAIDHLSGGQSKKQGVSSPKSSEIGVTEPSRYEKTLNIKERVGIFKAPPPKDKVHGVNTQSSTDISNKNELVTFLDTLRGKTLR